MAKRRSHPLEKNGTDAVDALRARSIASRIWRGLPLTKQQRSWWSEGTAAALLELGGLLALATHHKILNNGLNDNRLAPMALAQKSADAILDRLLGKPTERVQVASKIHVVFPGLDPSLLPDGPRQPKRVDARPAYGQRSPILPSPATKPQGHERT